jgi:hypothetical protein
LLHLLLDQHPPSGDKGNNLLVFRGNILSLEISSVIISHFDWLEHNPRHRLSGQGEISFVIYLLWRFPLLLQEVRSRIGRLFGRVEVVQGLVQTWNYICILFTIDVLMETITCVCLSVTLFA